MANDKDYEVGYRKPPKTTRFSKGRSGNPKGRPKDSKNLVTMIDQELDKQVVVQENGKQLRLNKREALVKRFVNNALNGDAKAMSALISMDQVRREAEPEVTELDETDREEFQRLQQRIIDRNRRDEEKRDKKSTTTKQRKVKIDEVSDEKAAR